MARGGRQEDPLRARSLCRAPAFLPGEDTAFAFGCSENAKMSAATPGGGTRVRLHRTGSMTVDVGGMPMGDSDPAQHDLERILARRRHRLAVGPASGKAFHNGSPSGSTTHCWDDAANPVNLVANDVRGEIKSETVATFIEPLAISATPAQARLLSTLRCACL